MTPGGREAALQQKSAWIIGKDLKRKRGWGVTVGNCCVAWRGLALKQTLVHRAQCSLAWACSDSTARDILLATSNQILSSQKFAPSSLSENLAVLVCKVCRELT